MGQTESFKVKIAIRINVKIDFKLLGRKGTFI